MSTVQLSATDINNALKNFAPDFTFENGILAWKNSTVEIKVSNSRLETDVTIAVAGMNVSASSIHLTKEGLIAEFTVTGK
jgi:hypothetical protein